jgi:RNA polymerase sigma factor (sigma-70 family)
MSSDPTPTADSPDRNALIAQMRPALVKYFKRKCGNTAEAEDLAQDVLVRAFARPGWTSTERARGYIFRAAVNRWRDRNRRALTHGTTVAWDDAASFALDEEISPERVVVVEQELHRVASALRELSERTRDVFMLIRLEQMKQAEIAAMLGISVSAVEKHLAKALAHLARVAGRSG